MRVSKMPVKFRETSPSTLSSQQECLRILLVEDDPLFVQMLTVLLSNNRGPVDAVYDAHKALDLLREQRYDLLITDIVMEGLSGVELIRTALEEKLIDRRRIFVVTGLATNSPVLDPILKIGIRILPKPFTRQEFVEVLESTLREG